MNPILEGGTGFIPGPFGTGKTVLQHALSRFADADIIIMAACGERGERGGGNLYRVPGIGRPSFRS